MAKSIGQDLNIWISAFHQKNHGIGSDTRHSEISGFQGKRYQARFGVTELAWRPDIVRSQRYYPIWISRQLMGQNFWIKISEEGMKQNFGK